MAVYTWFLLLELCSQNSMLITISTNTWHFMLAKLKLTRTNLIFMDRWWGGWEVEWFYIINHVVVCAKHGKPVSRKRFYFLKCLNLKGHCCYVVHVSGLWKWLNEQTWWCQEVEVQTMRVLMSSMSSSEHGRRVPEMGTGIPLPPSKGRMGMQVLAQLGLVEDLLMTHQC